MMGVPTNQLGMGSVSGKTAVVSGSTRGIGLAIARTLLEEGAHVTITGRDADRLSSVTRELTGVYGERVGAFRGDLTRTAVIKNLIRDIISRWGHLDVVVASIGSGSWQTGWDVEDGAWKDAFDVNFFGAVRLAREAIRIMQPEKKGVIIFISSIAGCEAISAPVPYATAKAALLHYMKTTASIVGRDGIRINAVSPGNISFKGGTWDRKMQADPVSVREYIRDAVPLQRCGTPEEIASMVCYLASDEASFITGANMVVDGGQTRGL